VGEVKMSAAESAARIERRSAVVRDALNYAEQAHRGQKRRDGAFDFISHPIAVAGVLEGAGSPDEVIAAALLHDVVEATPLDVEDVERRFGDRVAHLVAVLTENESIPSYKERKGEHRDRVGQAGGGAAAIYAADKLCNVRELRRLYELEGEEISRRYPAPLDVRIQLWLEDLERLSHRSGEVPFLAELEVELHELRAERARRKRA
jgi:guanosine-3',5'-bis(diphosphate) 3'-pyrophosphohydrolase